MTKPANKSRRVIFATVLICASIPVFFLCANVFPDQTSRALYTAETLYAKALHAVGRTEEDKIHEAVLRYLVQSHKLSGPVFLRIDGKDPSGKLIARLSGMNPAVKRVSEAELASHICVDPSTGESGVLLSLGPVRWSSLYRVEVDGGVRNGGGGIFGTYAVVKNIGVWAVQSSDEVFSLC